MAAGVWAMVTEVRPPLGDKGDIATEREHRFSVLIADDDRGNREALGEALEQRGFRTLLAEDGGRAVELVRYRVARSAMGAELFLRRVQRRDFVIETDDGRSLPVVGNLHVTGVFEPASKEAFGAWAPHLPDVQIIETVLRDGDYVHAQGDLDEVQLTDGYRDRKEPALRGDARHPVVVMKHVR